MEVHSPDIGAPECRPAIKRVAGEFLLVATAGALLAFAANLISPRGLTLGRDYFPPAPATPGAKANPAGAVLPITPLADQLRARGLQSVDGAQASRLYHDPRYGQESIVFIDARDDQRYQAGHIPGAYQFDHYHPENHIATALPACQAADQIIVYCGGGDCEDSQYAALSLREAGIPNAKLYVYVGGIKEWAASGLPMETGERKSGQYLRPGP